MTNLYTLWIKTTTNHIFHIHNIYNATITSKEPNKILLFQIILENSSIDKHIVFGNFNLHHSNWGTLNYCSNLLASNLRILAEQYHFAQPVPTETITYLEGLGKLTIDLFFATPFIAKSFLTCKIAEDLNYYSNYMLIVITISLAIYKAQPMNRRN